MKKLMLSALFAGSLVAAVEAAPGDAVTQADLQALIERITKLEAENKAQAKRIAELEGKASPAPATKEQGKAAPAVAKEEGTQVSDSGRVYTTEQGYRYYLADRFAGIFEPLSDAGLKITPYGWLVAEMDYNTHSTEVDVYTDYVRPKSHRTYKDHTMTFSMEAGHFSSTSDRVNDPSSSNAPKMPSVKVFRSSGDTFSIQRSKTTPMDTLWGS